MNPTACNSSMISILIVVSWEGHHPEFCAHFMRACARFSAKVYVICPPEADPIARLGEDNSIVEKIFVLPFANRAATSGFLKFGDIRADFVEIRSLIDTAMDSNHDENPFIFHTSLDSLFIGIRHLPALFLEVNKLLPLPFSGWMLSPDRLWPLQGYRGRLTRVLGAADGRGWLARGLNRLGNDVLSVAGWLLRWLYLWIRNLILRRSLCEQIALLDERYASALGRKTGKCVTILPDSTSVVLSDPPPDAVTTIERIKTGAVVVGMLGALERRKGIDLLLDVIRNHDTEGLFFVLAGTYDSAAVASRHRDFLTTEIQRRKNVLFLPQPVTSEGDFNAIVRSCDLLFCVYKDHLHSSNLVSKAAAFKKPVLVNHGELMAKRVIEYRLGKVLSTAGSGACLDALREMATDAYMHEYRETAAISQYLEDHSVESLQKKIALMSQSLHLHHHD
jgi:hypothetical protein